MTEHSFLILFILTTFSFLLSGYPVGFVLAGTSLIFSFIAMVMGVFDISFLMAFPNRLFGIMTNQNLLAVPLFILMGMILEKTNIAENLLKAMNQIYNNTSGGYAISVVLVGALMGASTGIVGASVVTLGLLSLPVMIKNNYPKHLTCGVVCASGTLGQIIPPSLVLILLADVLSSAYQQAQLNMGIFSPETVTIAELFAGAVIPGVVLPILYIIYIKIFHKNLKVASNTEGKLNLTKSFLPPILLIFLVLGSIIIGIATPSEAASLGVFGALLISIIQKQLNFNILNNCSKETIRLTSMIFLILIGATLFSLVFRGLNGEEAIQSIFLDDSVDKFYTLLIVLLLMFLLGFILDFIEIIFIVIPIFGPILFTLGFDPVWIGILIGMILQTSFLTPPFGFSIFYLRGVAPDDIDTRDIYKGILPFVFIQLFVVVLILLIPNLATLLPSIILS